MSSPAGQGCLFATFCEKMIDPLVGRIPFLGGRQFSGKRWHKDTPARGGLGGFHPIPSSIKMGAGRAEMSGMLGSVSAADGESR